MNLVQINQAENNEFITVIPGKVQVFPVDDINTAQKQLLKLVKKEFKALDITVEPKVCKNQVWLDVEDNTELSDPGVNEDHYFVTQLKKPSATNPVAELTIEGSGIEINWFLVK